MVNADNQIGALVNVDKIASFINNSKTTQKVLRAVSDNPALASAVTSFVFASGLRPAAQGVLPIKNNEDKKYTIASSVATGVTELLFAGALFVPLNKGIQSMSKKLYSSTKNTIYKGNPLLLRQFKSLNSRFMKLASLPFTSWLRFAAVTPFVKLLFDKNGGKKVGGKLDCEG